MTGHEADTATGTQTEPGPDPALLAVRSLARRFGETRALRDCTLDVYPGEVHALVGENGSGKSTLVKILSGVLRPGSGQLSIGGERQHFSTPRQAQQAGIATVFQETLVVEELSVRDNILLGTDGALRQAAGALDRTVNLREVLTLIGLGDVDPATPVWRLGLGQRQLVTIARALVRPWKVLILDEATSALDVRDRDALFAHLRQLTGRTRSLLLISHRMDEIRTMADRVTVLRSGVTIDTLPVSRAPEDLLLRLAAGSDERDGQPAAPARASSRAGGEQRGGEVLRASAVRIRPGAQPFDVSVAAGEIVGIAGLEGHGQSAFLKAVAGLTGLQGGQLSTRDRAGEHAVTGFHQAARHGIVYLPRDRKTEGILPSRSVRENMIVASLSGLTRAGVLRGGRIREVVSQLMARLGVRAPSDRAPITALSGGNQQKVILARALALSPRILVLDDPLRGVDHRSKLEIYGILAELAAGGMAIMILSTEIEELLILCDRIAVFRDGTVTAVLQASGSRPDHVVAAMFGRNPAL